MSHGLSASFGYPAILPFGRRAGVEEPPVPVRRRAADPPAAPEAPPRPNRGEAGTVDLVRRASAGEVEAWRELVAAYSGRLFGLLYRQCGDRDLAEELTQATFVKLVDKLRDRPDEGAEGSGGGGGSGGSGGARYDERGRFESWLFRIATNALRDELRRRNRQAQPIDMSPAASSGRDDEPRAWAGLQEGASLRVPRPSDDPADAADRAEQVDRLRDAVEKLPDADREVLYLRHTAGLSFAEIADTVGAPLGTVLARAHRALGKLRKLLPELADES